MCDGPRRLIPALFSKLKMRRFTGRHMQFHFSEDVLDARLRVMTRAGEAVGVEPQVFDFLVYLVDNRDRGGSGDALIEAVGDGRIVSKPTLPSRINAARRAVG